MKYHIGATAVANQRLREQPWMVQFIAEEGEPRHFAGEFTEQQLRDRIKTLQARDERVPPEYFEALKKLEPQGNP